MDLQECDRRDEAFRRLEGEKRALEEDIDMQKLTTQRVSRCLGLPMLSLQA